MKPTSQLDKIIQHQTCLEILSTQVVTVCLMLVKILDLSEAVAADGVATSIARLQGDVVIILTLVRNYSSLDLIIIILPF